MGSAKFNRKISRPDKALLPEGMSDGENSRVDVHGIDEDEIDQGRIRCVCGQEEDDGFTIQCEQCFVWQHAVCVGILKSSIPDRFYCELCEPKANFIPEESLASYKKVDTLLFKEKTTVLPYLASIFSQLAIAKRSRVTCFCPRSLEPIEICLVRREALESAKQNRNISLRSIKVRGQAKKSASSRVGLFSDGHFPPGIPLCTYAGEICTKDRFSGTKASTCTQSFVLFLSFLNLAVDSRKQGNVARFIRRSCRPNVQVRLLLADSFDATPHPVSIQLISRSNIFPGEELLLPIDVDCGNRYFWYECACLNPEFCLSATQTASQAIAPPDDAEYTLATTHSTKRASKATNTTVAAELKQPSAFANRNAHEASDSPAEVDILSYSEDDHKQAMAIRQAASFCDEPADGAGTLTPPSIQSPMSVFDGAISPPLTCSPLSCADAQQPTQDPLPAFSPSAASTSPLPDAPVRPATTKLSIRDYLRQKKGEFTGDQQPNSMPEKKRYRSRSLDSLPIDASQVDGEVKKASTLVSLR